MRINSAIIVGSFVVLLVSFWNRNELPGRIDYHPDIRNEPQQTRTRSKPFDVVYKNVEYNVAPEYAYDILGMIVSYRHHDDMSRMHRQANDHLNMLDVCVIWGDNVINQRLDKIEFWNGVFTCNVQTSDQAAWEAFDMNQLSNNHLISDDDFIRDQVQSVNVGDQIRVRGYLASYGNERGGRRGTSTTRTDTGNGACETVYVEQFDIVRSATSYWRISMYASLVLLILAVIVRVSTPYRPHR